MKIPLQVSREIGCNGLMRETLGSTLGVVLPHLPTVLANPDTLPRVQQLAAALPPIPLGGFEFRLAPNDGQVDLLQCIKAGAGAPEMLAGFVAATPLSNRVEWQRLREFCLSWVDPASPLHDAIRDIWLEFDLDGTAATHPPLPSVFMSLNIKIPSAEALAVVEFALPLLLGKEVATPLREKLRQCFHVSADYAIVSHVGLMLSRALEGFRVNVPRLSRDVIPTFLRRLGWSAPTTELEEWLAAVSEQVGYITLNLDIGARIYPRIGLECSFNDERLPDKRWAPFLDYLVARGLCAADKRDALLYWWGSDSPQTASQSWPQHLILSSLLQPPDKFGVIGRRSSHVKLVYQPGQPLQAKGYIGFGHLWVNADGDANATSEKGAPQIVTESVESIAPQRADAERALESGIEAATNFLLGSRSPDGWWEDFWGPVGAGDEWVTAYVATVLASHGDERADKVVRDAWALLLNRRTPSEGWGYNAQSPPDADSTGWGLQLAERIGASESERARAARRFVERHLQPDGSIITYRLGVFVERGNGSATPLPVDSWAQPHVCVTAAIAALTGFEEPTREFLRQAQLEDGSWKSFWSDDHEYATMFAAEALAKGTREQRARVPRAVEWACKRLGEKGYVAYPARPGGSPFATALCLRTLMLSENPATVRPTGLRALQWLLSKQRADGSWSPSVRLRIPPHEVTDPNRDPRGTLVVFDQNRNFTTATVLAAFIRLKRQWSVFAIERDDECPH